MAKSSRLIPVDQILLDPRNPRLVVSGRPTQENLATLLYENESLDELMPSLVANGFFIEEPLVVVQETNQFICVEGNRRLATLKLLLDKKLRRNVDVYDWPDLEDDDPKLRRLRAVPCVEYETRAAVYPFLGFRHITGAKKWEPFQKARFIADLVGEGLSIEDIQGIIGDTTQTVKRLYQDFVVFKQIEDSSLASSKRVKERFSLLEVALNQRPIKAYLGMPQGLPSRKVDEPLVPAEKLDKLDQVVSWVFGSEEKSAVVADSREIGQRLAKVIQDPDALEWLNTHGDLETAYEYTGGERDFLAKRLNRAERSIIDASGLAPLYAGDPDLLASVDRIETLVLALRRALAQ